MSYSFCFDNVTSPIQFNLQKQCLNAGFHKNELSDNAHFTDQNLTLNESCTQNLEYKHLLAALVKKHCPNVMPVTHYIDDQNFYDVLMPLEEGSVWILKPSMLNNARGIKIFDQKDQVCAHFLGSKRFDGPHVLQQYITQPHLLNGHKYTIRMFVVITNFGGVFLYKKGYFNVAQQSYAEGAWDQLKYHLTNEHLSDNEDNIWQMPTDRVPHFENIYVQVQHIVGETNNALRIESPELFDFRKSDSASGEGVSPAFSLFGFDFILDEHLQLWLLEVNHGPCFPKDDSHPLQVHLYDAFWASIFNDFVVPTTKGQISEFRASSHFDTV